MLKRLFFLVAIVIPALNLYAQKIDSVRKQEAPKEVKKDRFTLLVYTRTISDAHSKFRFDQNIVPNFRVTPWLRMELGIRQGEQTNNGAAYNHYKVELQSKTLFQRLRLVTRMSQDIVRYGSPTYTRTNFLFIAETKHPISRKFDAVLNIGYMFSYQKNNTLQAEPIAGGSNNNHGIYKVGIRYKLRKGYLEGVLGTYDVFNPYALQQPFAQVSCDYELFNGGTLYSYFRYQYDKSIGTPFNDFLGLGVKFRILK
ncbi:MAG: hypothetical protein OJF59_002034 [Cytophagales bacterium]|jgi:hypothetical protein|nr:hypothetical protein [Bacteroidota bacterium]WHZ08281.1 MAG: hypothetical protein OJF59_002034 [Cytophagales bacterium]